MAAESALARLAALGDAPEGLIAHRSGPLGQIAVARVGDDIIMAFCPPGVALSNDALSGVMARVEPGRPMVLKGLYTQAMLAGLALVPSARRAYVMGAGGGRLPLVLRHVAGLSEVVGSELDPDVLDLSGQYLGFENAPGLRVDCAEGRAHLSAQGARFDLILVDCFSAFGRVPPALTTVENYGMLRDRLSPGGVVAMNLVDHDPLFAAQRAGFLRSFPTVREWVCEGTVVLFGQDGAGAGDPGQAARDLAGRADFGFDLCGHVGAMRRVVSLGAVASALHDADVFDPAQAAAFFAPGHFDGCSRNTPCPCGSGRKFKACHGRR